MAKLIKKYDKDFTIFTNGLFKDKRLSYKELGLLVQLLSLPDNWEFNVKGIAKLHKDGEDSVKAGLVKLEEYGYLTRTRTRDENGKLSSSDYFIYQCPEDNTEYVNKGLNKEFSPQGENPPMAGNSPVGEKPPVEKPPVENPANKEYIDKESINNVVVGNKIQYDFEIRQNAIKHFEDNLMDSDKFKVYAEINDTNTFIKAMNKLIDLLKEQNLIKLEKSLKLSQKQIIDLVNDVMNVQLNMYSSFDNPDGYIVSRLNKMLENV